MRTTQRLHSWRITSMGMFAKRRTRTFFQISGLAILASVVALYSSFVPVQAASNTALKWTPHTEGAVTTWNAITWSPELGMFAAIAVAPSNNVMTSTDGKTWTPHSTPVATNLRDIVWAASIGKFLTVSPNGMTFTSTDGANWVQAGTIPEHTQWETVTWSPELNTFVALTCGVGTTGCNNAAGNRVAVSTNEGATWTTHSTPAQQWWNVDWSSELGLFVATTYAGGTQGVMTSPNGVNWTQRTTPSGQWWGVTYSPDVNLLVSVSLDGKAMTSPDGITWTQRTTPEANQWRSVAWSSQLGQFVAVAASGTNRVMTSPDGITWTAKPAAVNNAWMDVTWSPALQTFAAVANGGTQRIMTGSMITGTTTSATDIAETTATLQGSYVDNYPGATVFFRYRQAGSGGTFTSTSPQTATSAGNFTAGINGLNPNTTYEYTVVVQWPSATGTQEIEGGLETFTTAISQVRYRKTVNPVVTTITPGQQFTYTVTVENMGTTNLTGLSFTDDLSDVVDDATYGNDVNATIGTPNWNGSDQISWNGNLNAGQTATVTYTFTMNNPTTGDGQLVNSVVGTGPGSNCTANPAIDPDCRTMSPLPVLSSQKTLVSPANPKAGDTVDYQFVITNTGAAGASNVSVADDLTQVLDDASYNNDASASTGTVTYDANSKRLIWNGNLAASGSAGDDVTVTYSVKVNGADNLSDARLKNALIAPDCPTTPIFDPSAPGYDANCVTDTPVTAWMARKTITPNGNLTPGTTTTYTIAVKNTGAVDLTGSNAPAIEDDLIDVLDDATYNNDAAATAGTPAYAAPTLSWSNDLTAGQESVITYTATVKPESELGSKKMVNAVTGSMNCPATAVTNPDDSDFNADCAVLSSIATSMLSSPVNGSNDGSGSGGLAGTGLHTGHIATVAALLIAGGLAVMGKRLSFGSKK